MTGSSIFKFENNWEKKYPSLKCKFHDDAIVVADSSTYSYPISVEKLNGNHVLFIEGKIYDRSSEELKRELLRIIDCDFKIEKFLFSIDGEFYLTIYDQKKQTLKIYGDHLNRLPLYYAANDKQWVVSRDITLVQKIINTPIKSLNLAEFFVFDYNLCSRTIFESIYQLQLFENLELNLKSGEFTASEKKLRYNFHESEIKDLTDELLDNMVNKFLKACKNRGGEKNVVSLSGGMDSRSVAAGLKKIGMRVEGVTFQNEDKPAVNDVKLAEEIASCLGIKWSKILLTTNSFLNDLEEIIEFKLGIQPARFYYLFQYCKKVYELYGDKIIFWTGDGGDKVFPDLTHGITFDESQKLFNYIIKENYEFSIPEAAQLTGVSKKDLINQICTTIATYPGKNSGDKIQYFYLSGRMKRYIFEGEDRNRNFFWSTNPFLSKKFFELIMKIHPSIKKDNHFYTRFIGKLDQKTAKIRNENFSKGKIELNRNFYQFFKNQANSFLSRKSKEYVKSLFKGGGRSNETIQKFKNEISRFEEGAQPINMKLVKSKFSNYSSAQLSLILTALKVNQKIS